MGASAPGPALHAPKGHKIRLLSVKPPRLQGGYFVINGSEKVLIAQVRPFLSSSAPLQGVACTSSGRRSRGGWVRRPCGHPAATLAPRWRPPPSCCRSPPCLDPTFELLRCAAAAHRCRNRRSVSPLMNSIQFHSNWAQERMANNHVYVFRKSQPSKYAYVAECR